MEINRSYPPVQISFHVRRNDHGRLLERSLMVNIRAETTEESYLQFQSLKQKLDGELDEPRERDEEEEGTYIAETGKPCSDCGGRLVIRTAKNGGRAGQKFWGCVNFPQCHYTEAVE